MPSGDPNAVDVVVRLPKTLGPAATVGEARSALADDHVHMVLLTEDGQLLGTLVRDDLPPPVTDDGPALPHAVLEGRTVAPGLPAGAARRLLVERGERRRAVVDEDGRLLGLLCLKRHGRGFCSDAEVAARATDACLVTEHGGSLR